MISVEMVEELRKVMDVDYRLAEKALRKGKGTVDGAIIWLKKREERWIRRFVRWCIKAFKRCYEYMLIIEKEDHVFINVPVIIVVGMFILFDIRSFRWPVILIILFLLVVISKSSVKIKMKKSLDSKRKEKIKLTVDSEPKGTVIHSENNIPIIIKQPGNEETKDETVIISDVKVIEDEDGFNEVIISE